jgi:hypothetical protein
MSISDEDTDAGSDFIELQPISEYEENKENIELGIDLTSNTVCEIQYSIIYS